MSKRFCEWVYCVFGCWIVFVVWYDYVCCDGWYVYNVFIFFYVLCCDMSVVLDCC